jgi:hypothetical protein
MVDFSSAYTLSRISWQDTQNFSVFVSSSAVLKAPQKVTPAKNPPMMRMPNAIAELGRLNTSHSSSAKLMRRLELGFRGSSATVIAGPRAEYCSVTNRYQQNHFSRAV